MALVPVSIGELIDKITILEIKTEKIKNPEALVNIQKELDMLRAIPTKHVDSEPLRQVNLELWEVEDTLRECEKEKDFGTNFVTLARSVYLLNDKRARIKRAINIFMNSDIVEEKSYK